MSSTGLVKPSLRTSPSALPCTEHQGLTGPSRKTLSQSGYSQSQELLLAFGQAAFPLGTTQQPPAATELQGGTEGWD